MSRAMNASANDIVAPGCCAVPGCSAGSSSELVSAAISLRRGCASVMNGTTSGGAT
ncbi:hypothetical protein [Kibdelosporangium philippinense]|uniref:hypothetical protein n=1 Tax=Kibdelosporangium philippinense TaxID=211113 RepID=UPI0036147CA2